MGEKPASKHTALKLVAASIGIAAIGLGASMATDPQVKNYLKEQSQNYAYLLSVALGRQTDSERILTAAAQTAYNPNVLVHCDKNLKYNGGTRVIDGVAHPYDGQARHIAGTDKWIVAIQDEECEAALAISRKDRIGKYVGDIAAQGAGTIVHEIKHTENSKASERETEKAAQREAWKFTFVLTESGPLASTTSDRINAIHAMSAPADYR